MTKPFSVRELVLRVKGIIKRAAPPAEAADGGIVEFGPIRIVPERFEAFVDGKQIVLTSTEFKLLHELVTKRGKVLTRNHLLENVWGYTQTVTDRTVDTHIKRMRQKLGSVGAAYVETVRGVGYRFADSERAPLTEQEAEEMEEELGML